MKKNTESAILAAFQEMIDAGLPVTEFDPHEQPEGASFDWVFERSLTAAEKNKAKSISEKYIDVKWI